MRNALDMVIIGMENGLTLNLLVCRCDGARQKRPVSACYRPDNGELTPC
jgi:hypothetical protein